MYCIVIVTTSHLHFKENSFAKINACVTFLYSIPSYLGLFQDCVEQWEEANRPMGSMFLQKDRR